MDEADQAEAATEIFHREALANAMKPTGPVRTPGACGNCGEAVPEDQAYCDHSCREDAEHRYAILSRTSTSASMTTREDRPI